MSASGTVMAQTNFAAANSGGAGPADFSTEAGSLAFAEGQRDRANRIAPINPLYHLKISI